MPCRDDRLQPLAAQCRPCPELGLNPGLKPPGSAPWSWRREGLLAAPSQLRLGSEPCPWKGRGAAAAVPPRQRSEAITLPESWALGLRDGRRGGSWPWAFRGLAGGMQATESCTDVPPGCCPPSCSKVCGTCIMRTCWGAVGSVGTGCTAGTGCSWGTTRAAAPE